MQRYTIGEIYRLGLLKNHKGEPYTSKATVSKELRGEKYKTIKTVYGEAKTFSQSVIDSLNSRWN
jgi:hypothetical protein